MSNNYYFEKWKSALNQLANLVHLDIEYQEIKAHDKKWCKAVERLIGILGMYLSIYNEISECYRHNLQVQKTEYIAEIIRATIARILELKDQLRRLAGSDYQFMGHGLINHKLTTYDFELSNILPKYERPEEIEKLISEAIQRAKDRKEKTNNVAEAEFEENLSHEIKWWENELDDDRVNETSKKGIDIMAIYALNEKVEVTAEILEEQKMVTLIQAHERRRKVALLIMQNKQKKEKWKKELNGTLKPMARYEIRERSAKMIQRIVRAYFQIKREKIEECKRDEILNLKLCVKKYSVGTHEEDSKSKVKHFEKLRKYETEWTENRENIKQKYIKRKYDDIKDDVRDEIMYWFRKWFDEALYFYDIPKETLGGSILIVNEKIPSPKEWLEIYEAYIEKKRANKNKTNYELKYEKTEAKKELSMNKKAERLKNKMKKENLRKLMKNPNYHPGYYYPKSKKRETVIKAMENYKNNWADIDNWNMPGAKEKFVVEVDASNAYMTAKMEIRKDVDKDMRETLKTLRNALKIDYERNNKKMPEQIKGTKKRKRKHYKRDVVTESIADKLEDLAFRGFLTEYPKVKIEDLIGDHNFAGDDLRCMLKPTNAFGGETRALWWEKCRDLGHGFHRILLVGPKGSGKTTLVHALASVNDAVLYVIDPAVFPEELLSAVYLQLLANSIGACARATQPSVIYVKHVHKLNCRKFQPEDIENLNLIKRYFLRKLLKKFKKTDKITIVASCIVPWLANSKQMLKQFPCVVLLPETNYSAVSIILRNWLLDNHIVPKDLDIQSLAHVLQGYSFGHIKDTLSKFLTADRIIKIAAYGLSVDEIYNYFLEAGEDKVDYNRYLKWYNDKSHWGKKGKKLLEEQQQFQTLLEKYREKMKKKKKVRSIPSDVSTNVSTKS